MNNPGDDQPLHDVQAYQVSEERHQWIFFAILTIILMAGGLLVFLSAYHGQVQTVFNGGIVLGLTASILALLLAFAYFIAFRFFDDLFYLFLSIGWLSNACYLPCELLFGSQCAEISHVSEDCFKFFLHVFALSFASSLAFYASTLVKRESASSLSPAILICFWIAGTAAFIGVSYIIFHFVWLTSNYILKFVAYTAPGALFASYGLFRVGRHITSALKTPKMSSSRTLTILSFTFYFYALLQLAYPWRVFFIEVNFSGIFKSFFFIAFVIKFTNVYCLVKVLLTVKYPEFVQQQSELEALHERLNRQSQLVAIGAIAASIEHDMKTPLAGISTKLETMRKLYSDGKIREYIEKLEADKNRIAAIAKVVPFMRGAEDFYDRDKFMDKVSMNKVVNLAIKAVKVEMSLDTDKFFFRVNPEVRPALRDVEHFTRAYVPMMEQMVVNLFKNAIEAIRDDGRDRGVIVIRIATVKAVPHETADGYNLKGFARWVRVDVEDNGCGIPEENLPKLTSLFTTKNDRKPNGGIGLYIARRLIKIHDGCMGIRSVKDKGTTVTFYLPEWEAYQAYALGTPGAVKQAYEFDDEDIEAIHTSEGDPQETHAVT